jgi:hypothetical protein
LAKFSVCNHLGCMPISSAAVEQTYVSIWEQLPFNAQRAALQRVDEGLLAIADNPSVNWTEIARSQARQCALEMLRQCGEPKP